MTIKHSSYWYDYDRNDPNRKNPFENSEKEGQAANKLVSDHWPLAVYENPGGSFTIEWDEFHPVTSIFNEWTEEDFLKALMLQLEMAIEQELLIDTRGNLDFVPHEDNYE